MNFGIFLIIFSSVQTTWCSQLNETGNDTCGVCTISWFRRKRAQTEYTRWLTNLETTQEFIVKVLDDDLATHRTPNIVAVNIQPLTRNEKKIIVGGALVPLSTARTTLLQPIDYTRFRPPTTIPADKSNGKSKGDDSVISPRGLIKSKSQIPPPVKHPNRDESPPSGPQFVRRPSTALAQQYAPVAPVSFNRGTTLAPLSPKSVERFMYKTPIRPTRTFPLPDVVKPSRTTSKILSYDIFRFDKDSITDDQNLLSGNVVSDMYELQTSLSIRQTTLSTHKQKDDSVSRATENNFKKWRAKVGQSLIDEKESELSYNEMAHENENDKGSNTKVDKAIGGEKDDDQYELPLGDLELRKALNESLEETYDSDNSTEASPILYYDEEKKLNNSTVTELSTVSLTIGKVTASVTSKAVHNKSKTFCSMIKLRQLNFNSPRTLPEIVAQLKQWAETSPVAKWVDITDGNFTTMENPIYMMIVDDPSSGQIISAKKTVMIIAGIQGRDHHAVAAAMYVLYQLIERSEAHADLLTKFRFWVIPIFNPDGYDYSMTFPHKREWTKNLKQKWDSCKGRESCDACELYGLRCTVQTCYGVNLDRNFEYQWIPTEELRAEHPCGALYAGERQLSEPETRALTRFLHEKHTPIFTFVAFKEGDVLGVLYPYSHTRKRRAFDNVYRQRASHAASAAYSIGGRPYVAGQTSEFLPLYAGGIEDWIDGHLGIDNTYTVMMFRPSDSYNSKLITERVVHEAYAAMDTLLLQSGNNFGAPVVTLSTAAAPSPRPAPLPRILALILLAACFNCII